VSGPGVVAVACLALISAWRWQDGQPGWALLFLALATLQLVVLVRRNRAARVAAGGGGAGARVAPSAVSATAVEQAERHRPGWVVIALVGLVGGVVACTVFPPLGLVLAGLGLYAATRARRYGRVLSGAAA
jgi:hypothetical protein